MIIYPLDKLFSISLAKTEMGEFSVWNDILAGKVDDPLLIYGSSRAWVQVDPKILEDSLGLSAYNFGVDGHNFRIQHLRHSLHMELVNKPEYIIQIVDPATLQKRSDLYNLNQFLPYMLFQRKIYDYTNDYLGFSRLDYYIPLIRYSGNTNAMANILNYWIGKKKPKVIRKKGFKGNDKKWTNEFSNAKQKFAKYEYSLDSGSIMLFKNFIQECKNDSIKVIMVYPPEYIEGQSFIGSRKELTEMYEDIAMEYKIPFIDYSNDTLSYQKDLFYNVMHLNQKGAELFSMDLAHRLSTLLN